LDRDKEEQEDEKLSGAFSGAGPVPEAPATGTVKGNKVVFGRYVKESRTSYTAVFKGTIESATRMTGAVGNPFCGSAGCEWTGVKKK